jgi:hypothetical protein
LKTTAALFGRAGVTYVTRWTFPAGGKQEEARTEPYSPGLPDQYSSKNR